MVRYSMISIVGFNIPLNKLQVITGIIFPTNHLNGASKT